MNCSSCSESMLSKEGVAVPGNGVCAICGVVSDKCNEVITSTEQCRSLFKSNGLTYTDVSQYIDILEHYIRLNLKSYPAINDCLEMELGKTRFNKDGGVYLLVDSHYFANRECISFNHDGFIGFCGWASSKNAEPFIRAFIDWCNFVKAEKEIIRKSISVIEKNRLA